MRAPLFDLQPRDINEPAFPVLWDARFHIGLGLEALDYLPWGVVEAIRPEMRATMRVSPEELVARGGGHPCDLVFWMLIATDRDPQQASVFLRRSIGCTAVAARRLLVLLGLIAWAEEIARRVEAHALGVIP